MRQTSAEAPNREGQRAFRTATIDGAKLTLWVKNCRADHLLP
jgi:hypothetical protein